MDQVASHPSPLTVFPSSQASVGCLSPSPHWTVQAELPTFGLVPPVHTDQTSGVVVVPPVQI